MKQVFNRIQHLLLPLGFLLFFVSFLQPSEEVGPILFFVAIVLIFAGVASRPEPKTTIDYSQFDVVYYVKWRSVIPAGSVIMTVVGLIWLFIERLREGSVVVAMAFALGFGLLACIEYLIQWGRAHQHTGFTICLNKFGVIIKRGSWSKQLPWSNFTFFCNQYEARLGRWVRYIPLLSILVAENDKLTLNLYRYDPKAVLPYDQITTLPENYDEVVAYIKKFLPYRTSGIKLSDRL